MSALCVPTVSMFVKSKSNLVICIAPYYWEAPLLRRSDIGDHTFHTVLPAIHTRTIPAFTIQPQGVTALWLVLIAPTYEGMARLS